MCRPPFCAGGNALIQVLDEVYLGNPVREWMLAAAIALVVLLALTTLRRVAMRRLSRHAAATAMKLDDFVLEVFRNTRLFFLVAVALYVGSQNLALPASMGKAAQLFFLLAAIVQSGLWASASLQFWLEQTIRRKMREDAAGATTMSALSFVGRLVIWCVVVLLGLDNIGVNITALVTGLGIGGVAVALALQNVLGDLFASLSIVLDKPFVIGDFIIVNEYLGTVEHIGLKTTRIRSLSGEQVIFSNSDLLNSRIRNYKRMHERRVVFALGITYQTPYEKLGEVSRILREIIEAQPHARFDRAHFKEYADSSLNFEVVYYVDSPDFNAYMDIQQQINLEIYRRFEEKGISFAYPTRTVYIHNGDTTAAGAPPSSGGLQVLHLPKEN